MFGHFPLKKIFIIQCKKAKHGKCQNFDDAEKKQLHPPVMLYLFPMNTKM
jgi:hypothetical protein